MKIVAAQFASERDNVDANIETPLLQFKNSRCVS